MPFHPLFTRFDDQIAIFNTGVGRPICIRLKLKVAPGMFLETLQAVRLAFPNLYLGVDANGSCTPDDAGFLKKLIACGPGVIEQPFPPDRLDWTAALKAEYPGIRVCLDESIASMGHLVSAHQMGALDELNLKPGRVGGQVTSCQMLNYAAKNGLSVWVGGMFETGIGRCAGLRLAARIPDAKAHDLRPAHLYLADDLLMKPIPLGDDGHVAQAEQPVEVNWDAISQYAVRQVELKA